MKSYVCCLSTDNYLDGVLVLNENLKRINSKYPLLCIINENITQKTRDILDFFQIPFQEISHITFENYDDNVLYGDYGRGKSYLINTFDKLNVFSLTDYEKLVYLDSDLLILENIDSLFDYPHLSCPIDLPFNEKKFNSGVMVLKPNIDDFNALKLACLKANKEHRKIGDQDIINEYFEKITSLDYGYNMVREVTSDYSMYFDGTKYSTENRRNVISFLDDCDHNKIIHYIGKIKPFMIYDRFGDDYCYLYQYYLNIVKRQKNLFECFLQDDLVSVIVPVYNKEKYLSRCIESILNQTYSNLEIILVDDGSTDDSLLICSNYQKNDTRIKIINQKNSGVSAARNHGISESTGKYISFVDADDFIESVMIEELVNTIKMYNVDFVQCATIINEEEVFYWRDWGIGFFDNEHIILDFLKHNMSVTVWDKLYKRELLDNILFDTRYKKNEDGFFIFEVVKKATSFIRIGIPLYHYFHKKSDSLTSTFSPEKDYNLIEYSDSVCSFASTYYPNLKVYIDKFEFGLMKYIVQELDRVDSVDTLDNYDRMFTEIEKRLKRFNVAISDLILKKVDNN